MKIKHNLSILFMILLLASCKNGLTIFDQIDQETKLEDAVITGSVNSIVRSGNNLYASDGYIYTKDVNVVRGWSKIAGPGGTIIKLAADNDNLYALNNSKQLFYRANSTGTWKAVTTSAIDSGIKTIFWDGNPTGNPTAYLQTINGTFYTLSGSGEPVQTNEVTSGVILTRSDVTYTANGKNITGKSGQPDNVDRGSITLSGTIYSLTFSEAEKAIYAGTSDGLKKILVDVNDSGKIIGVVLAPPGNWAATINSYEPFAVLATGTDGTDSALYSSTIKGGSAYAKINGLWGYYYNRRSNWNRE